MERPGISPNRVFKEEFFPSSQRPTPTEYKNSSLRKFFNPAGSNSDRNQYTSILTSHMKSRRPKQNIEGVDDICSQILPSMNQSLSRTSAPLSSSTKIQEKKIFNQIYKLKNARSRPSDNVNSDQKSKKTLDELFSSKKITAKRDSQRTEDSKNTINNTISQISQKEMLNSFCNKGGIYENSIFFPKSERPSFEYDGIKGSNIKSIETSRRVSSSSKERNPLPTPPRNSSSQTKLAKSISPPPYVNATSRRNTSSKVNQIRRVGDFEVFQIDTSSNLPSKQEIMLSAQNMNQPVKKHKRGFSMDQASSQSQKTFAQAQKAEQMQKISLEQKESAAPQPNQNQNQANAKSEEAEFFEKFFDVDKMTFDFEKLVIAQRNKRKTESSQNPSLSSTFYTRQTSIHTRTKSTEECSNLSASKPPSRLVSKRTSLGNMA